MNPAGGLDGLGPVSDKMGVGAAFVPVLLVKPERRVAHIGPGGGQAADGGSGAGMDSSGSR